MMCTVIYQDHASWFSSTIQVNYSTKETHIWLPWHIILILGIATHIICTKLFRNQFGVHYQKYGQNKSIMPVYRKR